MVKLGLNLDFNSSKSYVDVTRTDYSQYGYSGSLRTALTSGEGFIPIGTMTAITDSEGNDITEQYSFKGTFDGDNKLISGLYMNMIKDDSNIKRIGLFASNYGIIKKLGLVNISLTISGKLIFLGGIVSYNYKDITQCYTTGNIKNIGASYIATGGICSRIENGGSVIECYNTANIIVENNTDSGNATAGGIMGQSSVGAIWIDKCYNGGNIIAKGNNKIDVNVGGIIGHSRNEIKNCYNTGKIEGYSDKAIRIGGINGSNDQDKNISYCYNIGEIKAVGNPEEMCVGGITGKNYANVIMNVFNTGKIIIEGEDTNNVFRVGGIASGQWNGSIINGYNIGNINISNNISEGIGGIIGYRQNATITNCNYLKGTYTKGIGYFYSETDTEEGVTKLESINDFPTILEIVNIGEAFKDDTNNINRGYPILSWQ